MHIFYFGTAQGGEGLVVLDNYYLYIYPFLDTYINNIRESYGDFYCGYLVRCFSNQSQKFELVCLVLVEGNLYSH